MMKIQRLNFPCTLYLEQATTQNSRLKTNQKIVAELTQFGWTIMSPGKEVDLSNMFLTQTTTTDYEKLCKLDVLGLRDKASADQSDVYEEFKEQLIRSPKGWYETGLAGEETTLLCQTTRRVV